MNQHLIEGKTGLWEAIIGLEVHAQVLSTSKLFSGAATAYGAEPNSQVSLVDAAFPGMLPVLNEECVYQAIRTGLGLNAEINLVSRFDRKNYFYPDLPAGYQISQFYYPIVGKGSVLLELQDGSTRTVGIHHMHLEQDAGKSLHDQHPTKSYIDLNRAGVALMEIVTEPDMRSSEEAMEFLRKLRTILRYLRTCDGNMDQGSLRADLNISVHRPGTPWGTRTETKNVNSIRFLGQAADYEIRRQIEALEEGGIIELETRLYDSVKGVTRSMRNKEGAQDYRYFPDPDLPPVIISCALVEKLRATLPELPDVKNNRFKNDYGLTSYDAGVIVAEKETADYFETAVSASKHPPAQTAKLIANWLIVELFALLNRESVSLNETKIPPHHLAQLIDLIVENVISGKIAKEIFPAMWEKGTDPLTLIEQKGLRQITDRGSIEAKVREILEHEADKVLEYKNGKEKLFGYFVGQAMKAMQGKANPEMLNLVLQDLLSK